MIIVSLRCFAHTLQLAANKILYADQDVVDVDGPTLPISDDDVLDLDSEPSNAFISSEAPRSISDALGAVRDVVKFFKQSGPAGQSFRDVVRDAAAVSGDMRPVNALPGLLLDVPTRWDSRHTMISRFCDPLIQSALDAFPGRIASVIALSPPTVKGTMAATLDTFNKLMSPLRDSPTFAALQEVATILGHIKAATTALSASGAGLISRAFSILADTYTAIHATSTTTAVGSDAKRQVLRAFEGYWMTIPDAVLLAIACDPCALRFNHLPSSTSPDVLRARVKRLMAQQLDPQRTSGDERGSPSSESSDEDDRLVSEYGHYRASTKHLRTSKRPANYDTPCGGEPTQNVSPVLQKLRASTCVCNRRHAPASERFP